MTDFVDSAGGTAFDLFRGRKQRAGRRFALFRTIARPLGNTTMDDANKLKMV